MAAIFYLAPHGCQQDTIRINGQEVNKTIAILRLLAKVNGDLRKQSAVCLLVISVSNVTDILLAMLRINGIGSDDNLHNQGIRMSILILEISFGHWWATESPRDSVWWPTGSDGWMSTLPRLWENWNPMENTRKQTNQTRFTYRECLSWAHSSSLENFRVPCTMKYFVGLTYFSIFNQITFFQMTASVCNCVELKDAAGGEINEHSPEWKRRKGRRMKGKKKNKK